MLFKWLVESIFMPLISLFGLGGNVFSIFVLRDKDVKLRRDFVDVLCALAFFDILFLCCTFLLFSLPHWTESYYLSVFPLLAPFLFPLTNIFMTASIYMTVAVAVNRYMEMSVDSHRFPCRIHSGVRQAVIVLVVAAVFNMPRWFEFAFEYEYKVHNETLSNGSVVQVNESELMVGPTALRSNEKYVRDYLLIANSVCVLLAPTAVMLVSTCLIIRQMIMQPAALRYTSEQEHARKKRNRSITVMLMGIIVLFIVCHIGEVFISLYEMVLYIENGGEQPEEFPVWAKNVIVTNHLLIVLNSSLNFAIYCKDLVFRQTVRKVYSTVCRRSQQSLPLMGVRANNNNGNGRMKAPRPGRTGPGSGGGCSSKSAAADGAASNGRVQRAAAAVATVEGSKSEQPLLLQQHQHHSSCLSLARETRPSINGHQSTALEADLTAADTIAAAPNGEPRELIAAVEEAAATSLPQPTTNHHLTAAKSESLV